MYLKIQIHCKHRQIHVHIHTHTHLLEKWFTDVVKWKQALNNSKIEKKNEKRQIIIKNKNLKILKYWNKNE